MMKTIQKKEKTWNIGVLSSIFAIVVGLLVGLVILLVSNPGQALQGFLTIITGGLTYDFMKGTGQVFYYATPIICTGLALGFANKTGLFNIGASGQFILGAYAAIFVGIRCQSLGSVHWIVALLAAAIAGGIWAMVPGLLKAFFNVNEVIAAIMMNYVGMYAVNLLVKSDSVVFDILKNQSAPVASSAVIPKMGLDKIFPGSDINGGFIIAVLAVIVLHIILNKTTFGYELKAVGYNRDASKYAGINEKKSIVLSMVISGVLAGLGGGLLYLAGSGKHIEIVDMLADEGFTGISIALLGLNKPFGILAAALFIAYVSYGGFYLQMYEYSTEVIDIIIAVIIYFSAFALIVKNVIERRKAKKERGEN